MEHIRQGEAREKDGQQKRAVPPKRDWQWGKHPKQGLKPGSALSDFSVHRAPCALHPS